MRPRLLQVVLEALRIVVPRGHLGMRAQRGLELALLRVRLVQQLNELRVPGRCRSHGGPPPSSIASLGLGLPKAARIHFVSGETPANDWLDGRLGSRRHIPHVLYRGEERMATQPASRSGQGTGRATSSSCERAGTPGRPRIARSPRSAAIRAPTRPATRCSADRRPGDPGVAARSVDHRHHARQLRLVLAVDAAVGEPRQPAGEVDLDEADARLDDVLDHRGHAAPGVRVDVAGPARDLHHVAGAQPALLARDGAGGLALEQREALDRVLEVPVRRGAAGARRQRPPQGEALGAVVEDLDDGPARAGDGVAGLEQVRPPPARSRPRRGASR